MNVTKNIRTELELSYRKAGLSDITVNGVGSGSLEWTSQYMGAARKWLL